VVVLFPEGTRSTDGTIGPLHKGTARMALRAGVPLIPVVIQGTDKVLPRTKRLIRLARITVRAGKPLRGNPAPHRKVAREDIDELQNELQKELRSLHREGSC